MTIPDSVQELPGGSGSFLSLLAVHDRLGELFQRHQVAVLRLDVDAASDALEAYERELREHIRFEEEELFPIYSRGERIAGGGSDLLQREHEKLLRYVNGIRKSLEPLCPREPGGPARVIELLDFEAKFKGLVTHHDLRERNIFYPALDRIASPREAETLLARALVGV